MTTFTSFTFVPFASGFPPFAAPSFVVALGLDGLGVEEGLERFARAASGARTMLPMDEIGSSDHAAEGTLPVVGPRSLNSSTAAFPIFAMAHGLLGCSAGGVVLKKDCFHGSQLLAAARLTCSC